VSWADILHAVFHFDQSVRLLVTTYGVLFYLILFAIVFCETAFLPLFFLPGDPLLFVCGAFCANGVLGLGATMSTLFVAAFAGYGVNYRIGRYVGARAYTHNYRWLNRAALERTHAFCERHGSGALLIAPYVAVVRTFAPFVAGMSNMKPARFVSASAASAALWVGGLVLGGYWFGNIPLVRDNLSTLVLSGAGIGVLALVLGGLLKLRRSRPPR
jgi:membrane-associated protein